VGHAGAALDREVRSKLVRPGDQRVWCLRYAIKYGMSLEEIYEFDGHRPCSWRTCKRSWNWRPVAALRGLQQCDDATLRGPSSSASPTGNCHHLEHDGNEVRQDRQRRGIVATFKSVDTCAAEFEAYTPYYYSTYEDEDETRRRSRGSGG